MELNEIKSSGLLELYVLGRLDPKDTKLVEDALSKHMELRHELSEIEFAFEAYARNHAVQPTDAIREKIFDQISPDTLPSTPPQSGGRSWLSALLTLATLALAFGLYWQNEQLNELQDVRDRERIICDSIQNSNQTQIALLNQINDRNNDIVAVAPTEKYPETDLYFHHNTANQRNFIQIKNLPAINDQQSYQLWSLKANQAPIPLDVFRADDGSLIIPVRYEDNTSTYAITIEQLGGAQIPNLADLIGTFTIS